jgi:general secretion pathway protein E
MTRSSEQAMAAYARSRAPSISDDGKAKILAGVTSVEEVLRVSLDD